MQIKAARFADAGGAYGAFTYYVHPQMRVEKIGDKAASNNTRILFYQGNILVDAVLEHITAMSGADLRALADALPRPKGNQAALPTLPANLPAQSLLPNTTRYVAGPVALGRIWGYFEEAGPTMGAVRWPSAIAAALIGILIARRARQTRRNPCWLQ